MLGKEDVETPGTRCQPVLGKEKGMRRQHMLSPEALVRLPLGCGELRHSCPAPRHLLSAEQ
eukprot:10281321-Prorocentrum_lima.AAC.1